MAFTRASATALLHRVQHRLSSHPVELVSTPHDRWPIPHSRSTERIDRPLRVLVLDSSFNPPTLAHLALANTNWPFSQRDRAKESATDINDSTLGYDAKLLLLSVRNADKSLKAGDASYIQRLEMMSLLTKHILRNETRAATYIGDNNAAEDEANVAVAIIDEPTFVGKSSILRAFLSDRLSSFSPSSNYDIQLTFILGFDTLERVVSPRYYSSEARMISALRKFLSPPPTGDDSRIVCARRGSPARAEASDRNSSESSQLALAQEFIASERITLVDIGESVRSYSSSTVRDTIAHLGLHGREWVGFVPEEIAEYIMNQKLYAETTS